MEKSPYRKRPFRIRSEINQVIPFLQYELVSSGIKKDETLENVLTFSLHTLINEKVTFTFLHYEPRRHPTGYKFSLETWELFTRFRIENDLEVSEAIELCIFFYIYKNFNKTVHRKLKIHKWNITIHD